MLSKLIERMEDAEASFPAWAAGFLGVLFVRFFLEDLSSPPPSFPSVPDVLTLIHYFLFYTGVLISLALIMRLFVPDILKISKFLLLGFPIIWLAPLYDLLHSSGAGAAMAYIFTASTGLFDRFFAMGGSSALGGVTAGIKTELIAILIGIVLYVFCKTKSVWRTLLAAACSYCALFLWLAFPSLLGIASGADPYGYLLALFSHAHAAQNFLRPTVQLAYPYAIETLFNLGFSYCFYLIDFALLLAWWWAYRPELVRMFLKNSRPGRVGFYFSLLVAGLLIAMKNANGPAFANWIDVIAFVALLLSYFCAWLFSVGINDIADTSIDRVSNPSRPLVKDPAFEKEMRQGNVFFVAWALVGSYLLGYWAMFSMAIFVAAYYIYSAPPMRLKRIPFISMFLISLASLSALMSGFYFGSSEHTLAAFPRMLVALVIIGMTLGANVKDIKDIEGDRADGIWTIPVIFGEKRGKIIIGACAAAAFLSIPVILAAPILFLPSLLAAVAGYYFIALAPYREWRMFCLYFLYIGTIGAMLWAVL